ncbi:MAG TPA: DUF397 domain-containing protein [Streptosporangiaceae bacterium]
MADSERADLAWRTSTASGGGNCVQVAFTDGWVLVRNSQSPSGPMLSFSDAEWDAFLIGAREGEFDRG